MKVERCHRAFFQSVVLAIFCQLNNDGSLLPAGHTCRQKPFSEVKAQPFPMPENQDVFGDTLAKILRP